MCTNKSWLLVILVVMGGIMAACSPQEPILETDFGPGEIIEIPIGPPPAPVYAGDDSELVIFIKEDYLDPDLYGVYEERTGIEITENNFQNGQELISDLFGLSDTESYGLIFPSNYMIRTLIEQGMLARLDQTNIPNLRHLGAIFKANPVDPGNQYCVPYLWGTTGLGYDAAIIQEPQSWGVLFNASPNDQVYGRYSLLDDPREAFATALLYLGYNINTTDENELEQAKALLIRAKNGLSAYDSQTYSDQIATGETILAHGQNGAFVAAQEVNTNLKYSIPEEGGVIWIDYMCIPGTSSPQKKVLAEEFINFLLEPEVSALNSEYTYLASPNETAKEYLTLDILGNPQVYPADEVIARLQFIVSTGAFEKIYQLKWDEVKNAGP